MLDVIICANFGVEKLRDQILEFPIEMAGHLYNRAGATAQPVIAGVTRPVESHSGARENILAGPLSPEIFLLIFRFIMVHFWCNLYL